MREILQKLENSPVKLSIYSFAQNIFPKEVFQDQFKNITLFHGYVPFIKAASRICKLGEIYKQEDKDNGGDIFDFVAKKKVLLKYFIIQDITAVR